MVSKIDLVNVKVSVNGKEQTIKMERGTSFENKGGIFTAGENNDVLKMTNYQARTFLAMANNSIDDNETIKYDEILKNKKNEIDLTGAVLSKKDIQEAQQKYRNRGFVADMSEFLPEGYRIERPKLTSAENMVQAYVTNGKESQSTTLKFSFFDSPIKEQENDDTFSLTTLKNAIKNLISSEDVAYHSINSSDIGQNVKMQDGVSFEVKSKVFLMENGNLMVYDKKNKTWQKQKNINFDDLYSYQEKIFKLVAEEKNEINSDIVLSKKDIQKWQKHGVNKYTKLINDYDKYKTKSVGGNGVTIFGSTSSYGCKHSCDIKITYDTTRNDIEKRCDNSK